jgi:hypothetical protein
VPHGPGYLAVLAEGSGAGNGDRVLQTVLELDRTAFLQPTEAADGYYPRKLETTFRQWI